MYKFRACNQNKKTVFLQILKFCNCHQITVLDLFANVSRFHVEFHICLVYYEMAYVCYAFVTKCLTFVIRLLRNALRLLPLCGLHFSYVYYKMPYVC